MNIPYITNIVYFMYIQSSTSISNDPTIQYYMSIVYIVNALQIRKSQNIMTYMHIVNTTNEATVVKYVYYCSIMYSASIVTIRISV